MRNRLPVGPGSRGGRWSIDPEFRRAYYRAWRRNRPEYRAREALRAERRRHLAQMRAETVALPTLTEAVVAVVREEADRSNVCTVARELLVGHRTVGRWIRGERVISGEGIDAVVAVYGLRRILAAKAALAAGARREVAA